MMSRQGYAKNSMEIVSEDLSTLCRLCGLKTDEMSPIFAPADTKKEIAKQIRDCFPIIVRKIGVVSKLICKSCTESLQIFHEFWNKVSEANEKFDKAENPTNPLINKISVSQFEDNIERKENYEFICLVCIACNEILFEGMSDVESHENCKTDAPNNEIREIVLDSLYKCEFCDRCYVDERSVNSHKDSHVGEKPYVCLTCNIYYTKCDELTVHKATHGNSLNSAIARPKFFTCQHCDKTFFRLAIMKIHQARCRSGDSFTCNSCGNQFSEPKGLFEHQRSESNKMWQCHICPMSFGSNCALRLHNKKELHGKKFICADCGKEFFQKKHLIIHTRSHTGEKRKDITFRIKRKLEKHKRIHTVERPLQCSQCEKSFITPARFREHEKLHTDEKSFKCNFCGKTFKIEMELKNHKRIHTGEKSFQCSQCEKAFINSARLREHTKFHTDEKPFKCNFCGKGFKRYSAKKIHMTTHTGEKAFKCDTCDKAFKRKADMKEHKKIRHGATFTAIDLIRN